MIVVQQFAILNGNNKWASFFITNEKIPNSRFLIFATIHSKINPSWGYMVVDPVESLFTRYNTIVLIDTTTTNQYRSAVSAIDLYATTEKATARFDESSQ